MRVLVCGSRDWRDVPPIWSVLDGLNWFATSNDDTLTLIEGGARGADSRAAGWAMQDASDFPDDDGPFHEQYPADWAKHGRAAGPIRNQQMLDEGKPDLVVAFSEYPITRGTQDMVTRAKKAGLPVWVVSHG